MVAGGQHPLQSEPYLHYPSKRGGENYQFGHPKLGCGIVARRSGRGGGQHKKPPNVLQQQRSFDHGTGKGQFDRDYGLQKRPFAQQHSRSRSPFVLFLFFWINPKKYSSGASLNKIWRRLTANGGCPTNSTGPVKHSADQLTNSNGIILTNASAQIGTTRPISRPMFFPAVVEDSLRQMARPLSIGRPSPGTKQTGLDDELRDHLLEEFEMK